MQHRPILKLDSAETKPLLPFWHDLRSTECGVQKTDGDLGLKRLHGFCKKNTNIQIFCFHLTREPSKKVAERPRHRQSTSPHTGIWSAEPR